MYSIINWNKGTPKTSGFYIVISESGQVDVARWYLESWFCSFNVYAWSEIWDVPIYNKE